MHRIHFATISTAAISLALAGLSAPAAYADTLVLNSSPMFQYSAITVTATSPVSESFSDGGAMYISDTTTGKNNILMYCVDIMDSISAGASSTGYTATPLFSYTGFSSAIETNIAKLFTKYLPLVNNTDTAVGFQEALWTVIYAGTAHPYAGSADATADGYASTWSSASNLSGAGTNGYALTVWSNNNVNQTLISFTPTATPEPSTWVLLVLGLGLVFLAERHRRART